MEREVKEQFEALFVDFFSPESGNVIVELRLSRESLAVGTKVPVSFTRRVPCETCKGKGRAEGAPACAKCDGKGRISQELLEGDKMETFVSTCPTCDGRGYAQEHACKECEKGFSKVPASVEVEVPMGSAAGMQVRVPGQGHVIPEKPQGDVVVVLSGDPAPAEKSPAAQKLPSMMVLLVITIVVLVLAIIMGRS